MAQHDYTIGNASGQTVRTDINNVLQAIATVNSDNTEPATMYAGMLWHDTGNSLLKLRNDSNTAWTTLPFRTNSSNATPSGLSVNGNLACEDITCDAIHQFPGYTTTLREVTVYDNMLMLGDIINPTHPAFRATASTTQVVSLSTVTQVTNLGDEEFDLNDDFSSNEFTAPIDGVYHFDASMVFGDRDWASVDASVSFWIAISTDGGSTWSTQTDDDSVCIKNSHDGTSQDEPFVASTVSGIMKLDEDDMVALFTYVTDFGGSAKRIDSGSAVQFCGHLISGTL